MSQMLKPRILVVDDELAIADAISTALRYEGFDVDAAFSGREALASVHARLPDLVVLDVMLPDFDGVELTRKLREEGILVPILFLTARDAMEDMVAGLGAGGDDYVTKPFALVEIVARIQAILRRAPAQGQDGETSRFVDLEMNHAAHEVRRMGQMIELTATEYSILEYFMLNPRRILTKSQILSHVWHYDFGGDSNIVETYISSLRKKLDVHGPPLIFTRRLVGYILSEPVEEKSTAH
jgi:two-component system OmpR family response regulator